MRSEHRQPPLRLKAAAMGGLLFLHVPLAADHPLCLHHGRKELPVPAAGPDAASGSPSPGSTARTSGTRCGCRSRWRSSPRCIALVLGTLRPRPLCARAVLRQGFDLAALHPADRTSRHHHRHRAALGLRHHGHPVLDLDHRAGPRHLLHRRGLQQRAGPLPPAVRQHDRGVDGPGRRRLPDLPPCGAAADRLRPAGRRHAGLRAVLRRGDRHHLHGGPAGHACRSGC